MKIDNKIISSLFKISIFIFAFIGITTFCGIYEHKYNFEVLLYYTLITNSLCMVYFGIDAIYILFKNQNIFPKIKSLVTFGITVTGVVFWIMLSGTDFEMGEHYPLGNLFVHYLVPIFCVLDWLLFDDKGKYNRYSPFKWLLLPVSYFVFVFIIILCGYEFTKDNRFPYFFVNIDKYGISILGYIIPILLLIILIGFIYVFIDYKMNKSKQ